VAVLLAPSVTAYLSSNKIQMAAESTSLTL